jgi:hypothetical protein
MSVVFVQNISGDQLSKHSKPRIVFPGSFNPLHVGHVELARVVSEQFAQEVHFELSIANVDKADLTPDEVNRRVLQFRGFAPVWVTRAARFIEKAMLFPDTRFLIGHDTAIRLFDVKYYSGDEELRDQALAELIEMNCSFVVAGRLDREGNFQVWQSEAAPPRFRELFIALDEQLFRRDVSSTQLRQNVA